MMNPRPTSLAAASLLVLAASAPAAPVPSGGGSVMPPRPMAAWTLDDGTGAVAADRYGDRDGALEGTGLDSAWHPGTPFAYSGAGCLELNGDFHRVLVGEHANILTGRSSCTVSAWFYWADPSTSKQSAIYGERDECQYNVFFLGIENRTGTTRGLSFAIFERSPLLDCGIGPGWHVATDPAGPPTPDEWHHAVGVLDETGGMRLYLDGALVASNEDTAYYTGSSGHSTIGHAHHTGYDAWWPGSLDEVAVWGRALGDAEVLWLYEHSIASMPPDPLRYCTPASNSTGSPALMSWSGSTSVSANDLVLSADPLPVFSSGLMIYSPDAASTALGNGVLCVGSTTIGYVLRLPAGTSDGAGVLTHALDLTSPPSPAGTVLPGSTWYFSCWYRDVGALPSHFNFADGLEITFWP